jgi:tripartite-type tricarboxylate transporter receptor subunit TctC
MTDRINRRQANAALGAALFAPLVGHAQANDFPNRPIRLVVGFGPGAGLEVASRLLADILSKDLGQSVTVENKPGGSTMIAAQQVVNAPKDGYTLYVQNNQTANNELLYKKVPYKNSDFINIAAGGLTTMVMTVSRTLPVATGAEFIKHAKANPGKVFYGFWGAGGSPHLLAARLNDTAGLKLEGVGYKDPGQATADLVTGRIHLFFTSATHGLSLKGAGSANLVAVGSPTRMASMPDVPTFVESGIEGMPNPWWGYAAPAGTPSDVVLKLERAIKAAVATPRYQELLAKTGSTNLSFDSPAKFQEFITRDQEKWAAAIRPLNLSLD